MNFKKYKPILEIVLLAVLLFIIHKIVFSVSSLKIQTFQHSLEKLYGLFLVFSVLIVFTLIKIREKNLDYVGYTFLLLTSLKMVGAYVLLRPILHNAYPDPQEKINFFVIFILFLALETVITIRLLNNKQ